MAEQLRESASMGNNPSVEFLLNQGINPNDQHKMNGFTALHWAYSRGHDSVVELLLANGADPNIKDSKGRIPKELAKQVEKLDIIPSYIANPDLGKLWNAPSLEVNHTPFKTAVVVPASPVPTKMKERNLEATVLPSVKASFEPIEILVYQDFQSPNTIKGAIFVYDESASLGDLKDILKAQIDGIPNSFLLFRIRTDLEIPLNQLQSNQMIKTHFQLSNSLVFKGA
jgi:hypothetical protein